MRTGLSARKRTDRRFAAHGLGGTMRRMQAAVSARFGPGVDHIGDPLDHLSGAA
jgi:hypothetical protein